jgi:1-acyl-sn-glycerol-3-phosphate acyltransferase
MVPKIVPRLIHFIIWLPLRLVFKFFIHLQIKGEQNLSRLPKGFIIAANHSSVFDPFIITDSFPFESRFFPQRYAMHYRYYRFPRFLVGWLMSLFGAYPVQPGLGVEKTLDASIKALLQDERVLIFPRGKITSLGRPRKARPGVAYMAQKSGKMILPVYLKGARKMGFGNFFRRQRKVTTIFGPPFYLKNIYPRPIKNKKDLRLAAEAIMRQVERLELESRK